MVSLPVNEKRAKSEPSDVVSLRAPRQVPARQLLDGLVARRPAAVAELFDRFAPAARGMLVRILGDSADVDDLVQDTFVTVVAKAAMVREPERLQSFVAGVAARLARNHLRKRKIRRWVGLEHAEELPISGVADELCRERLRHLYRALDHLDSGSRTLIVMRDVEGVELADLADMDGCSLATLKRRLVRARKRFDAIVARDPVLSELGGDPP